LKITKILPRKLALEWQKYDLNVTDNKLEYYKAMAEVLQTISDEGHEELRRLRGGQ